MTPTLIELPELYLLGISSRFLRPGSPAANNLEVIPRLYERFSRMLHTLPLQQDKYLYGASRLPASSSHDHPDELEYLAAISVDAGSKPKESLELWKIPASRYACFTHHGPVSQIGETLRHVYEIWLPGSTYALAHSPALDRQDERFHYGGKDCALDCLIPIRPR